MSTGTYLSEEQVALLLKPIHPQRVLKLKGMSYVEGYDIRAELNRVFGFGRWDQEILDQTAIREAQVKTKEGNPAWNVVYRTRVRLTIKAPDGSALAVYESSHVGESTHPVFGEAHGNALTNSETYALRRCAINLGDQFGLSLYNKGSMSPLVRWTLVRPQAETPADTDDVPQVNAEQGGGQDDGGSPAAAADLSGWKTRIGAATTSEGLDAIRDDARRMRSDGELGTEDAARITGTADARAAELDRAARKPEPAAAADGDWAANFRTRVAAAGLDSMRPMKVEVMRAVSSKVIDTDTGNEMLALIKEHTATLEGATSEAA